MRIWVWVPFQQGHPSSLGFCTWLAGGPRRGHPPPPHAPVGCANFMQASLHLFEGPCFLKSWFTAEILGHREFKKDKKEICSSCCQLRHPPPAIRDM